MKTSEQIIYALRNWGGDYDKLIDLIYAINETTGLTSSQKVLISELMNEIVINGDETEIANICTQLFTIYSWEEFQWVCKSIISNSKKFSLIRLNMAVGLYEHCPKSVIMEIAKGLNPGDDLVHEITEYIRVMEKE